VSASQTCQYQANSCVDSNNSYPSGSATPLARWVTDPRRVISGPKKISSLPSPRNASAPPAITYADTSTGPSTSANSNSSSAAATSKAPLNAGKVMSQDARNHVNLNQTAGPKAHYQRHQQKGPAYVSRTPFMDQRMSTQADYPSLMRYHPQQTMNVPYYSIPAQPSHSLVHQENMDRSTFHQSYINSATSLSMQEPHSMPKGRGRKNSHVSETGKQSRHHVAEYRANLQSERSEVRQHPSERESLLHTNRQAYPSKDWQNSQSEQPVSDRLIPRISDSEPFPDLAPSEATPPSFIPDNPPKVKIPRSMMVTDDFIGADVKEVTRLWVGGISPTYPVEALHQLFAAVAPTAKVGYYKYNIDDARPWCFV
jgi:hypothetical protein